MINVITNHGSSFKGLATYLLHDIEGEPGASNYKHLDSSERVAWTETLGLATDDPWRATKVMIATAKSQAELKAEAGIAKTGNKSHKHVMHYVLSWSAEHDQGLTKEEMLSAAKASMTYLGTYEGEKLGRNKKTGKAIHAKRTQHADEHQAVIVCHQEEGKNPHVHIMLNRVHPGHGVMLPDTKDYEKLSAWALDYRRAQGKEHLCPARIQNAAKRAQGILTNDPRKPRNVYEQEKEIAEADPGGRKKVLLEQHRRRAKELKAKTEATKDRHAKAMRALEARQVANERAERVKSADQIKAKTAEIRASYAPKIDALAQRHTAEVEAFKGAKGTAAGHVRNTWAAFKTKQWMTEIRTSPLNAMKHSFTLAFNSGLQLRDIQKHHAHELGELRGQRTGEERDAAREVRMDEGFRLDELRQQYYQDRNDLVFTQGMDKAKRKAEWQQLRKDWLAIELDDTKGNDARRDVANDNRDDESSSGGGKQSKPKLSQVFSEKAEQSIEQDNPYDIPIDELREIARELKQRADPDKEQDREQDRGMDR